ncbi:MAG TPA: hypothetical protein VI172_14780 [Candidatus Dormibacteraeota bacterium]|jgi:hypothetical protein
MTATISPRAAVTAVHEAAALHDDGLTVASLQVITHLDERTVVLICESAARWGAMSRLADGRWKAHPACSTCGWGERHPDYDSHHLHSGGCHVAVHHYRPDWTPPAGN